MRLQTKLLVTSIVLASISVAFLSLLIFSDTKVIIQHQTEHQLESISDITEQNMNTFIEAQQHKIELIATQSELSQEELLEMLSLDPTFYDLFVINASGMVVVSSNPQRLGLHGSTRDYFTQARNQTFVSPVYLALVPQVYSIAVSTPFHEGVLVGAMRLDVLNEFTTSKIGLGETGESLLAFLNDKGDLVYFTQRRFSNNSWEVVPRAQAESRPIYQATKGVEGISRGDRDYRGVIVLAVTNYVEQLHLGLVTKIDESETLSPIRALQTVAVLLAAISITLLGITFYFVSRSISSDIGAITTRISQITQGNLELQLPKSGLVEIQGLIDSLNRILASLKLAILRVGTSKEELGIGGLEDVQKAKKQFEEKFEIVAQNSKQMLYEYDPVKGTIGWSGAVQDVTGYTVEEFNKFGIKEWEQFIHPIDRKRALKALGDAMKARKRYDIQYRFKRKGGSYALIEDIGLFTSRGTMLGTMRAIEVFFTGDKK